MGVEEEGALKESITSNWFLSMYKDNELVISQTTCNEDTISSPKKEHFSSMKTK